MLLCTLGAYLLGNLSTGKGAMATSQSRSTIRADEFTIRTGKCTITEGYDF